MQNNKSKGDNSRKKSLLSVFSPILILISPFILGFMLLCYAEYKEDNLVEKIYTFSGKGDYEKAHELLNELRTSSHYKYEECNKRVIIEEGSFLISQGDEQSAQRVIYLLLQNVEDEEVRMEIAEELLKLAKVVENNYMIDLIDNFKKQN